MKHAEILFGLAALTLLTSCSVFEAAAEFLGIATGDATPEQIADAADRNRDGVIEGFGEWAYLLLLGGAAGAAKTARMMGVPIPKLGPVLDKVGLGRTKTQQREDAIWEAVKADREKFDADRVANAIQVAEKLERDIQGASRAEA